MTIGDLLKHIAATGRALQHANPDLEMETFHAIPVVLQIAGIDPDHSQSPLASVRVFAVENAISLVLSNQPPEKKP